MKKLLLLLCALLGTMGAWATDVTIIKSSEAATTYGSLSGTTFTTNAASGLAGVTIEGIKGTTATNFAYGACLGLTSTASGTITMTAPTGYIITGYTLTARSNTYAVPYTLTPSAGGSPVTTSTGGVTLTASGLDAQAASFTYSAASANSFYIPSMTITILAAGASTVDVTYELYESDGTTLVSSVTKEQEANSAIEVPSSLTAATYYDYATSGSIGDSDCTIKVTRTLKSGYVISLDGFSNSKCYNIRNNRGTWAVGSGATDVNSTVELSLAFLASDVKQQFAFITYEGNVYLYSVGESKFAYVDGSKLSLTSTVNSAVAASPVTFQASTNATYKYSEPIIVTVGGKMYGVSTGKTPDVFQYDNHPEDGGNCAYIIEAGSFDATAALAALDAYFHPSYFVTYVVKDASDNTLFTSDAVPTTLNANITTLPAEYQKTYFYTYNTVDVTISETGNTEVEFTATPKSGVLQYTANTSSPVYYNLNIRGKYLAYNDEATGDVELLTSSTPFNPDAAWAFIGDPYTGFKIINQTNGTDKYLTYTSVVTGSNHGNNNIQFVADASFTNQYWYVDANTGGFCLRMKENTNIYFHHDSGNNFLRTCSVSEWSYVHNDAGSTIVFASDEDVLVNLYNDLKDVFFADGVGKYTWGGSGTAEEARANINGAGSALQYHVTSSYKDLYDALLDIKENISLNLPTAGFYRIKGKTSNKYLAAGLAGNSKFNMTTAEDATTIFYYDGTKLTNLSSGMCNGVNASDWAWVVGESASEVTFHDGHTPCGYGIQTATAYFYDNGDNSNSSADRGTGVNMSSGNTRYRSWELTEVNTLPVTVSTAKFATLYAPVALTVPSGVAAYAAEDHDTYLKLIDVGSVIPANTGVILYANIAEATTYNFEITTTANTVDDNVLTGTVAAIARPDNSYILSKDKTSGEVGFFKDGASTIPGFKAYQQASGSSLVKSFVFDTETAVKAIEAAQNPGKVVYDLNGRRVENPVKGLYIVNGKKILVK